MSNALLLSLLLALPPSVPPAGDPARDPAAAEIPLPAEGDWQARLVLDRAGVGVWTTKAFDVFEQYAGPQAIGLDDDGRCWVLVCYSGKWTPFPILEEGGWLGAVDHGDVDPRAPGAELYVAGEKGNVYQVRAHPSGVLDARLLASFRGEEVHALVAQPALGEAPPAVVAFTGPGIAHRLTPTGAHGGWEERGTFEFGAMKGRVRDAACFLADGEQRIAVASRTGEVALLRLTEDAADLHVLHRSPVGKGRVALGARVHGWPTVYTTQDDGVILRHVRSADGENWRTDVIHRGHQGPRGIAVGHFDERHPGEQVAIFGYSSNVELLVPPTEDAKRGTPYTSHVIFRDSAKGHWLNAIEIDGRNDTTELLASGYGGRIVLLARPPIGAAPAPADAQEGAPHGAVSRGPGK